jgi:hypothetical protein
MRWLSVVEVGETLQERNAVLPLWGWLGAQAQKGRLYIQVSTNQAGRPCSTHLAARAGRD